MRLTDEHPTKIKVDKAMRFLDELGIIFDFNGYDTRVKDRDNPEEFLLEDIEQTCTTNAKIRELPFPLEYKVIRMKQMVTYMIVDGNKEDLEKFQVKLFDEQRFEVTETQGEEEFKIEGEPPNNLALAQVQKIMEDFTNLDFCINWFNGENSGVYALTRKV